MREEEKEVLTTLTKADREMLADYVILKEYAGYPTEYAFKHKEWFVKGEITPKDFLESFARAVNWTAN